MVPASESTWLKVQINEMLVFATTFPALGSDDSVVQTSCMLPDRLVDTEALLGLRFSLHLLKLKGLVGESAERRINGLELTE
jgi:hypothetical protein